MRPRGGLQLRVRLCARSLAFVACVLAELGASTRHRHLSVRGGDLRARQSGDNRLKLATGHRANVGPSIKVGDNDHIGEGSATGCDDGLSFRLGELDRLRVAYGTCIARPADDHIEPFALLMAQAWPQARWFLRNLMRSAGMSLSAGLGRLCGAPGKFVRGSHRTFQQGEFVTYRPWCDWNKFPLRVKLRSRLPLRPRSLGSENQTTCGFAARAGEVSTGIAGAGIFPGSERGLSECPCPPLTPPRRPSWRCLPRPCPRS